MGGKGWKDRHINRAQTWKCSQSTPCCRRRVELVPSAKAELLKVQGASQLKSKIQRFL